MYLSRHVQYLLLAIGAALTVLQLQLMWNVGHLQGIEPFFLCYAAVWFLLWRRRTDLQFKSSSAATLIGLLCIALVLFRGASMTGYDSFLRFAPILSGLGLALLSSGFSQFKTYWRELLILGFLMIPTTSLIAAVDLTGWTAGLASNLLWYSGHSVTQAGTRLTLSSGAAVDVYPGCSGAQSILQLLTLAFLFVNLFPLGWFASLTLPIVAVIVGFLVNGVRVALMAILVDQANQAAFDYWHLGDGSLIFSMVAVFIFGAVCYFVMDRVDANAEDEGSA